MIVKLRGTSEVSQRSLTMLSAYTVTPDFKDVVEEVTANPQRHFRVLNTHEGQIILLPHSNFVYSEKPDYALTLTGISTVGLFDFVLLSSEGNQNSALFWGIIPAIPVSRFTLFGVVAATQVPAISSTISVLSQVDGLVVAGDSQGVSTAVFLSDIVAIEPV